MSERGLDAFLRDLQESPDLLEQLKNLVPDVHAGMAWAWAKGYQISRESLEGLFESYQELADEDLEAAAGGWSGTGDPPPAGGGGG